MNRYEVLLQKNAPRTTDEPSEPTRRPLTSKETKIEPRIALSDQEPGEPSGQSTTLSTSKSTPQSVGRLGVPSILQASDTTVERPKAFYITKRLDHRLDEAVRYYQDVHGIKKVDRSAIVNAMLDTDANWTDEALDQSVSRIMSLLTSRLTD
jgi:hypothetical protein